MNWIDVVEIPPWGNDSDWKQAVESLRFLIEKHGKALECAFKTASDIENMLVSFFPLQDQLVDKTCVSCQCPCCETATVWLDFRDLLFIHLTGQYKTERQLIGKQGDICNCYSEKGCTIPRLARPWVCTMYFCPQQMKKIRSMGDRTKDRVHYLISSIREARKALEDDFIRITSKEVQNTFTVT